MRGGGRQLETRKLNLKLRCLPVLFFFRFSIFFIESFPLAVELELPLSFRSFPALNDFFFTPEWLDRTDDCMARIPLSSSNGELITEKLPGSELRLSKAWVFCPTMTLILSPTQRKNSWTEEGTHNTALMKITSSHILRVWNVNRR